MPFEPSLLPSPDDDDRALPASVELPDELVALGEQLSNDAAALVETYPASRPEAWKQPAAPVEASANRRAWLRRAAAVVLLASGSAYAWSNLSGEREASHMASPGAGDVPSIVEAKNPNFAPPSMSAPFALPAAMFELLSGPEQEALLDLIESEGFEQSSLSI